MVAMDENRKPTQVPKFEPSTPDEIRRYKSAELRKEMRKDLEIRFKEIRNPKN